MKEVRQKRYELFVPRCPRLEEDWPSWIEYYARRNAFWRLEIPRSRHCEKMKCYSELERVRHLTEHLPDDVQWAILLRTGDVLDAKTQISDTERCLQAWDVAKRLLKRSVF
jgi:hypothetical protein